MREARELSYLLLRYFNSVWCHFTCRKHCSISLIEINIYILITWNHANISVINMALWQQCQKVGVKILVVADRWFFFEICLMWTKHLLLCFILYMFSGCYWYNFALLEIDFWSFHLYLIWEKQKFCSQNQITLSDFFFYFYEKLCSKIFTRKWEAFLTHCHSWILIYMSWYNHTQFFSVRIHY